MKKNILYTFLAALALVVSAAPVQAEHGHWEGRGGDMHHWGGGSWHHGWYDGRLGWWWVVGGLWYPYAAPIYPYPDPYAPPVVVQQAPPPAVVIQQTPPAPSVSTAAPPSQVWYYCEEPKGYYPYVPSCAKGWRVVPATPSDMPR